MLLFSKVIFSGLVLSASYFPLQLNYSKWMSSVSSSVMGFIISLILLLSSLSRDILFFIFFLFTIQYYWYIHVNCISYFFLITSFTFFSLSTLFPVLCLLICYLSTLQFMHVLTALSLHPFIDIFAPAFHFHLFIKFHFGTGFDYYFILLFYVLYSSLLFYPISPNSLLSYLHLVQLPFPQVPYLFSLLFSFWASSSASLILNR